MHHVILQGESTMKKLVLGYAGLVLFALSGSAMAADLSRPPPPAYTKAPMMPLYNWNGIYLGINGGGGWGRSRLDFPLFGTTTGDFNTSGGLVGGTVGFNWQSSAFVFGVEGDGDWANIKGSAPCPGVVGFTCNTSDSWLATARARLGYAANEWLFYVTGGGAFGDVKTAATGFSGQSVTRTGWTAGGGIEYGFAPNWSVKVEYLHVDLGTASCSVGVCSFVSQVNAPFRAEIVRAGLNWRFNWGGPVVARY
jgi:outer membrane immunogenic protein